MRAAARDSAQQQAVLWQGDMLEVRGHRLDFLQVYDHRRERAGYVRASQVRSLPLAADEANDLLAVVRFLRDTPGAEALGIGYAAAYLKAAPAAAIGAEPFDALGMMADRLARRASSRHAKADDAVIAAHLEVAASYGIVIKSFERDGRVQLCYDGEAFRRVLALKSTDEGKSARGSGADPAGMHRSGPDALQSRQPGSMARRRARACPAHEFARILEEPLAHAQRGGVVQHRLRTRASWRAGAGSGESGDC